MQKRPARRAGGRRNAQRVQPRFWLISFGVIAVVFGVVFYRGAQAIQKQQAENATREAHVQAVSTEVDALKRKLQFIQTDRYAEQEARRRYGYIKEGETRFMLDGSAASGIVSMWNEQPEYGTPGTATQ